VSRGCENRFRALTDSIGAERRIASAPDWETSLRSRRRRCMGGIRARRLRQQKRTSRGRIVCLAATARTNGQCAPGRLWRSVWRSAGSTFEPFGASARAGRRRTRRRLGRYRIRVAKPARFSDCAAGLNSLTTEFLAQYVRRLVLLARSARPRGPPALALWRSAPVRARVDPAYTCVCTEHGGRRDLHGSGS
jgi:hypothetical protein